MLVYNKYVSLQTMAIQDFSNFIMHQNHLEGLLKGRLLEATADFFGFRVSGVGKLRMCTSNKFPGDVHATGNRYVIAKDIPLIIGILNSFLNNVKLDRWVER